MVAAIVGGVVFGVLAYLLIRTNATCSESTTVWRSGAIDRRDGDLDSAFSTT